MPSSPNCENIGTPNRPSRRHAAHGLRSAGRSRSGCGPLASAVRRTAPQVRPGRSLAKRKVVRTAPFGDSILMRAAVRPAFLPGMSGGIEPYVQGLCEDSVRSAGRTALTSSALWPSKQVCNRSLAGRLDGSRSLPTSDAVSSPCEGSRVGPDWGGSGVGPWPASRRVGASPDRTPARRGDRV